MIEKEAELQVAICYKKIQHKDIVNYNTIVSYPYSKNKNSKFLRRKQKTVNN